MSSAHSSVSGARSQPDAAPLHLSAVTQCCVCGGNTIIPQAVGEDFEYRTSPDTFLAVRCSGCGLVFLDPRPERCELSRIYPDNYHAYDFSPRRYGLVFKVRQRLEARRLLAATRGLRSDARILDVGCGDGFHLKLLRQFGRPTWQLEGVDASERAVAATRRAGLVCHLGDVEAVDLPKASYDLVLLIATIEHMEKPRNVLAAVRDLLVPGGRILIVTDNTETTDFKLFKRRHWGGYHFPRHFNLFNRRSLSLLASRAGLVAESLRTIVSPVNWVYSIRNLLDDLGAPAWLVNWFSLRSPVTLSVFTVVDFIYQCFGRGALLQAVLRRPLTPSFVGA